MGNPAKGWTPERGKRQSEAIKQWNLWAKSIGPKSPEGNAAVARNAKTGGHLLMLRKAVNEMIQAIRQQRKGIGL